MTRDEIIKQWELEFGQKFTDYQRANVYTSVDIIDFAESVVKKLTIPVVSNSSDWTCDKCGEIVDGKNVTYLEKHEDCGGQCT